MPFINDRLQENQERLAREERASRPERAPRFVFEPEAVMARRRARIVGQAPVLDAMEDMLRVVKADIGDPHRPLAVNLFMGPTGVGKTETVRLISEAIHGRADGFCRIDMNTLAQEHYAAALTGAPPGYVGYEEGGQLTDEIRRNPHTVLLLDEIEKAHPDVFNILLQVMDNGQLTDHNGRAVNFRNVVLIMTSNAGASDMAKAAIGFGRDRREGEDTAAIERTFTPEFRNRLDAVIAFAPLPKEVILQVVEKFVLQLEAQLMDRNVSIELTRKAAEWLADRGYDDRMGARPLGRVIQEHIKKPLAEELLFGKLAKGGLVKVGIKDGKLDLRIEGPTKPRISGDKPPLLTAD